jgi:hypothetical protein
MGGKKEGGGGREERKRAQFIPDLLSSTNCTTEDHTSRKQSRPAFPLLLSPLSLPSTPYPNSPFQMHDSIDGSDDARLHRPATQHTQSGQL